MKRIVGWVLIIYSAWSFFALRFSQIDVTEARLLIDNWQMILFYYFILILGFILQAEK
jgi:hypothetical protein